MRQPRDTQPHHRYAGIQREKVWKFKISTKFAVVSLEYYSAAALMCAPWGNFRGSTVLNIFTKKQVLLWADNVVMFCAKTVITEPTRRVGIISKYASGLVFLNKAHSLRRFSVSHYAPSLQNYHFPPGNSFLNMEALFPMLQLCTV